MCVSQASVSKELYRVRVKRVLVARELSNFREIEFQRVTELYCESAVHINEIKTLQTPVILLSARGGIEINLALA